MKNTIKNLAIVAFVVFGAFSFTTIEKEKKEIKTDKSKVVWKGYKVTGSHEGNISIESGHLVFDNEKLVGGEFVIDMSTITVTDIEGGMKAKLEGHLKSDDFFGVANNPKATLVLTNVSELSGNVYSITGDLTIKGKTNAISFELSLDGNKATTSLKIDRTKFGIEYKSASFFESLKDKAISDEFDLVTNLEF